MSLATGPAAPLHDDPDLDQDLARRVRQFLATRTFAVLRRLRVQAIKGEVVIDGVVDSYYERQLAIACVKRVAGVRQVIDMIHVQNESALPAVPSNAYVGATP